MVPPDKPEPRILPMRRNGTYYEKGAESESASTDKSHRAFFREYIRISSQFEQFVHISLSLATTDTANLSLPPSVYGFFR